MLLIELIATCIYGHHSIAEKEEKLERLVTELPDQPVVNTVLDGYSKSHMVSSFSNSLHAPGGIYRKEVEPLARPTPRDPSDPALLPVENRVEEEEEEEEEFNPQYEVCHGSFFMVENFCLKIFTLENFLVKVIYFTCYQTNFTFDNFLGSTVGVEEIQ